MLYVYKLETSFLKWRSDLEKGNYDGLEESALAYHQNLRSFLENNEISNLAAEIQQGLQQLLSEQQSLSKRIVELKDDTAEKRILGPHTSERLQQLSMLIKNREVKQSRKMLGEIGVTVCANCHSIHRTLGDLRNSLEDRMYSE